MRLHDGSGILFSRFLAALLAIVPHSAASAPPSSAPGTLRGVIRLDPHHVADYADVRVPELRRRMSADAEGRYQFDVVPPGDYQVVANVFGRTEARGHVHVVAGGVATLDLQVGEELVVGDIRGTEVIGNALGVRADQFGAHYRVDEKKIREYRLNSLVDVAGQQAGVVNTNGELHLRGGRAEELKVLLGGIEAFDVLGSRNAQVAVGAVANVELVSGGVNPENGNALSGVLSVTTREGSSRFGGDLRWDTDRYGDPTKTFERYDRLSLDAGGPTAVPALTWFATYEGTFQDGAVASGMTHPQRTLLDFIQLGNRQDNRVNTQWKLAWTPSTTHKLTLEGIANRTLTTPYVHSWSRRGFVQVTYDTTGATSGQPPVPRYGSWSPTAEDSSFVAVNMADHVPTLDDRYRQFTLAWRFTPDTTLVATTRLALVEFHTTNSVGGREPWDYWTQSPFFWSGNTVLGSEDNPYFATHGDYPLYSTSRSRAWTLKGDVTSARWSSHRVKVGLEAHAHEVRNLALTFPNGESNGLPGAVRSDYLNRYPQGGAFVHDLWRYEGLVLSTGVRFDVFSPGQQVALSELPSGRRYKHQWSPRLGVSYPVSDRDALSFNYGWTYQTVTSAALFENRGLASSVGTQGNPDLEPETDVSYQAALQHAFTRDLYGQFSVFFRDIYGLLTVRPERDAAGNQVSVWSNGDYASTRGFELSLARGFSHHFSSDVAYTYSVATGVASDPAQAQQFVNGGKLYLPISERALRWDQRHSLSWQAALRYPGEWGMHVQWSYSSGLPFTPQFRNDRRQDPKLENSRRLPTASRLGLSGDRYLKLWGQDLTLFVDARNVFDARNIAGLSWGDGFNPNVNLSGGDDYAIYYTETGRAGGAYLQDTNGDHVLDWVPLHDPRVFEEGRNVRLGLAMRF
jgi:outer membrane receptor protein involved in Fe transport